MVLQEMVKSFLNRSDKKSGKESSEVNPDNVISDLTHDDLYPNTGSFFDDTQQNNLFGSSEVSDIVTKQKEKIMKYRNLAQITDVSEAIDEIVNEIIFSYDDIIPLKFHMSEENEKIEKAINEKFNKIVKISNLKRNLFHVVKNSYIDGQLIFHCAYDEKNTSTGIKSIKMIEPSGLYFDSNTSTYKYLEENRSHFASETGIEYSVEEIIKEDFGLFNDKITLSYLEYAIKPANMLKTLEDLLVPLRFSRSISRRVFNVDVGDLPNKRATEVMSDHQTKFKYKKFYNNETGEVTNQQHITSMVEDYWFANRSGGKGTTVDVLDESGNLGELGDIIYFAKKLYRSMKIPSNRVDVNPEGDKEFDFDTTRVSKEDLKFFMFISRLRQVYSSAFMEILKREVIATGILSVSEWDDREDSMSIQFTNENKFIEQMNLANFTSKLEIYSTAQEYAGKLFSVQKILREVFRMSEDEMKDEMKAIQKEEKNPLFKKFYEKDDDY